MHRNITLAFVQNDQTFDTPVSKALNKEQCGKSCD